jgi:hypothetical protein
LPSFSLFITLFNYNLQIAKEIFKLNYHHTPRTMEGQIDHHPTPLGNWLEDLFNKLFYQPDDGLCKKAMEEEMSPQLRVW